MRIVAVTESRYFGVTPSGGAEMMLHLMLRHLVNQGWDATAIISAGRHVDTLVDGVRVICPVDKHQYHQVFQDHDVAITHLGGTPRGRGMSSHYGIPLVQLIHNTSEYSIGFLGDGCDYAIYNSEWVSEFHDLHRKDELLKVWQRSKTAFVKLRTCSEWPSMVLRPPVLDPIPGMGGGPGGAVTLINLVKNKGPDVFYALAERHPDLQFHAVVGGYQMEAQDIRDLPNVRVVEHTSDINSIYGAASVIVMPSVYESYGLVAVEAMGRGIPVIASPTPGLQECMGPKGLFRERSDLDGWSEDLTSVLANYVTASDVAVMRYAELYRQSEKELQVFDQNMRRLVEEWDYSRSTTSS